MKETKMKRASDDAKLKKFETKLDEYPLIAFAPLDVISIILGIVAVAELGIIRIRYYGSSEWPTLFNESFGVMISGMIGVAGMIALRLLAYFKFSVKSREEKESRRYSKSWREFTRGGIFTVSYNDQTLFNFFGAMLTYTAIQVFVSILRGSGLFQVASGDVYAVYLSSAVCEEVFYRGLLVGWLQFALFGFAYVVGMKKGENFVSYLSRVCYDEKGKRKFSWVTVVCMVASGGVFASAHLNYWGDPSALLLTFLGGMAQTYWFVRSNCLLVTIGSHAVTNFAAANNIIQGLNG